MRVAVLGAGLQGACVAMELALNGIKVDLYDRNERCLTQASAQNEGKIHLGYVYAADPTLNTARLMVRGAATFSRLMRRWIGSYVDRIPVSRPFYYAVHRDSLLSPEQVEAHLRACRRIAEDEAGCGTIEYFGADACGAVARVPHGDLFDHGAIVAAFTTPEISIDPEALCNHVRAHLESESRIRPVMGATVEDVTVDAKEAEVGFEIAGERFRERYDCVVNALWDGRLAIDARLGILPERPWLFRVKHYLRGKAALNGASRQSVTIVLGPFGDLVTYPDGEVHLSWYPAGMRGMSSGVLPPQRPPWPGKGHTDALRRSILAGLSGVIPALAELAPAGPDALDVRGGVIFATGQTDIDDPASGLHLRSDIGPRSFDRYHSIDTGKLTMAPLFAKMTADRIRGV